MNAYVIQRLDSGAYVAPRMGHLTFEPHKAFQFVSREAARQYVDRYLVRPERYGIAILPATRPLLSVPKESAA